MDKGPAPLENRIVEEDNFLTGFTLTELIIVVVIVGILVTFAIPQFAVTRERALDREAKASLALMRAAEKIYRMEVIDNYYPYDSYTTTSNIGLINTNLRLSLPASASPNWDYSIDNSSSTGIGTAARSDGTRTWTLDAAGSCENPTCSGAGCPEPGGC